MRVQFLTKTPFSVCINSHGISTGFASYVFFAVFVMCDRLHVSFDKKFIVEGKSQGIFYHDLEANQRLLKNLISFSGNNYFKYFKAIKRERHTKFKSVSSDDFF